MAWAIFTTGVPELEVRRAKGPWWLFSGLPEPSRHEFQRSRLDAPWILGNPTGSEACLGPDEQTSAPTGLPALHGAAALVGVTVRIHFELRSVAPLEVVIGDATGPRILTQKESDEVRLDAIITESVAGPGRQRDQRIRRASRGGDSPPVC